MFLLVFFTSIVSSSYIQEFTLEAPFDTYSKYWKSYGDVVMNESVIEITPDKANTRGLIVSKKRISMKSFKIEMKLLMTSSIKNTNHSNGIAFWFTQTPLKLGNAFGAEEKWQGLSIIFDTFKNGKLDVPTAQMIMNYNNKHYKGENDGIDISSKSCYFGDYRETPFTATFEYKASTFEVSLDLQQDGKDVINCFKNAVYKINIGQYFGISASSGNDSDSHQLLDLKFTDTSIRSPKKKRVTVEEPKLDTLNLEKINKAFTQPELEERCKDTHNEKCYITALYETLGSIKDEVLLNLKLEKEKNTVLLKILKAMEKTSKSPTDINSAAKSLELIHNLQDSQAETFSDFFTTIGDLLQRIQDLATTFYSSSLPIKTMNLTEMDYFIFILQFSLLATLLIYSFTKYTGKNRVI
ncbi:vesicular mannose-binding lectin, putative [Entamoeba invadens IP1]|uniref:Vesicular mannose-binding lectin, putative n=1 Tax=Entamoeba invadens IP1 TaxID=370355 RepID=A0A0A1TYG6_ENTIV|nr:vesicular mannose-binding lectin, putative [Entamoeba invadens IP1]ELP86561.1 vesicular mannose-binding lectin, putative [Entamoeba invadens IP1]|eukprot:XP_004185907.1 vesicular mannose-binding lectin, putative [Entamoeba invadens IP1]